MKLMITGSRSITDFDLEPYIPKETELIISGGAAGIDSLAERYADKHKISKLILRPNNNISSKIADLLLSFEMVSHSDSVLIIWDEKCEETKRVIDAANKSFKPVRIITVK